MARVTKPLRPAAFSIPEKEDEIARWIADQQERGLGEVLREAISRGLPAVDGYPEALLQYESGQVAPRLPRVGGAQPKPGSRRARSRATRHSQ